MWLRAWGVVEGMGVVGGHWGVVEGMGVVGCGMLVLGQ